MEKLQIEEKRAETTTQAKASIEGTKMMRKDKRLVQHASENVCAPSNLCRQRRSPNQYIGYMTLMTELVENEPSSFEEAVEKHVWVDVMVEEYESIVKNSVFGTDTSLENW